MRSGIRLTDAGQGALAFVDLETTGTAPTRDRITEIGIVAVEEDGSVTEWSSLVNPETAIPHFIQSMTGISDAMVSKAPTFALLAAEISQRLHGRLFIAHNARFDYGFLKNEFRRAGVDFRSTVACTVKLSRKLFPGHPRHGLDALIERHGLTVSARHRALDDARLIHQFWTIARGAHSDERFSAVLGDITARPSLPPHIDSGIVEDLPDGPGVYLFHGENALIYVGKAKNLRHRVLGHFSGDHASEKEMALAQQVRRIEWITTGGETGALLREARLIRERQPTHNRQLRRNQELCSIQLVDQGDGLVTPEIVEAAALDFGGNTDSYGLFKHKKEAERTLAEIADTTGLCPAVLGLERRMPGRPCFARQLRKCRGACSGEETLISHAARLVHSLASLKLHRWPFDGPAVLREGDELLVIDRWRFLGSAKSETEVWELVDSRPPPFDRDSYRILVRAQGRLRAVGSR